MKLGPYIKLVRPKQWVKNGFVLAPAFFSGNLEISHLKSLVLSLVAFCILASCVYILNDLRDLEADRAHDKKKHRPMASGAVPVSHGMMLLVGGLIALAASLFLLQAPVPALVVILLYALFNIAYSLGLKHVAVLELMLVSSGFILRLLFGAFIIGVTLSSWIVICTGLLAMMITVGKRRGDLVQGLDNGDQRRSLSSYTVAFLDQSNMLLATSTFAAYLIFCTSGYAVARFGEEVLITAPIVLFGLMSYMRLMVVEGVGDDPSTLILSSNAIRLSVLAYLITFVFIIYY
ncbi:MAG: hypothetical protein EP335_08525 [Alphaproteobacteria bacterium]|nr:MAG: hypothetical protein EP335_08525 [Alphaproteobacteria bacterium]